MEDVKIKVGVFLMIDSPSTATVSKQTFHVLIIDDAQQTLAPLEESLKNDSNDIILHRIQSETTYQLPLEDKYDVVVLQNETNGLDERTPQNRIVEEFESVETIVIADNRNESPLTGIDELADKVFEVNLDSTAQYQIVATGIREYLLSDRLDPSLGDGSSGLPKNFSESDEAILLIEGNIFVDCTDAAAQFLGYEAPESIRGCHPAELSPPTQPDGQSSKKKVNDVIQVAHSGGYHRFNWVHTRADGREQSVIVSLMPVITEDERVLYCVWREPPTASAAATQSAIKPKLAKSVSGDSTTPRVLVVDKRGESGVAATIERSDVEITAMSVSTCNEAQLVVESRDDIDCVVLSLQLPDTDAKPFIEQLRATDPGLPVMCVDPIERGHNVDPNSKQRVDAALFETLQSDIDGAQEHRDGEWGSGGYQAAFEMLQIPIAFFQHHEITFFNSAFETAVGRDSEVLQEESAIETIVHPDDQRRFTQILADWQQGDDAQIRHDIRLRKPDGTTRHFNISGVAITITGTEGVLVLFWDITDWQQRKQDTEFERVLFRIILDQLIDARTQDELDTGIVEGLVRHGHDLAWIGTYDGTDRTTRAVSGDQDFYATLDSALTVPSDVGEPAMRAAKTGSAQYVGDLEKLLSAEWRDAALEEGYQSSIAVPLSYHDTAYGVLAIYSRDPDPFSERDQRLLTQFADAVAFASHSLHLENALATNTVTEATITIGDDAYYLVDLAHAGAFDEFDDLRVVGSVPNGETAVLQYITAHGSASVLRERLAAHTAVADVSIVAESDPVRMQVTVTDNVPEGRLAGQGIVVRETAINTQEATLSIELPPRATLQSAVETLNPDYENVSTRLSNTDNREVSDWQNRSFEHVDLTDKQLAALQAAYYNGYFERPRKLTATEIADSLGVGHSTFLQHLHRAQEKVFGSYFK
jgi:PAS domain S-box-containing protein